MTERKPVAPEPSDDEVVYLDDGGSDDVARALEEAERAVSAVEERHRAPAPRQAAPAEEHGVERVGAEAVPADAGLPGDLERRLSEQKDRAEQAEEDAGRLREALLRKVADFENLKKRTEREKNEYVRYALADAFRELLSVLDNFERAMAHSTVPGGEDDFRKGVEMIARQLADTLRKFGLVEVDALGKPFDPTVHEAVMREETREVAPGTVTEVLQKGYLLNERLLRPAFVKVAAAPPVRPDEA